MIADLILILVMALCVFLGYKRGLIKVAVRILSFIVALVVALILYNPISNYIINNTEVVPNISNAIHSKLYNQEEETEENNDEEINTIENYIDEYTNEVKHESVDLVAQEGAVTIVRIGTWIGLFFVTKVAMIFVRFFADIIGKLPIIKQFNKAGGIIYGILEGFAVIYVVLAIFSMISPMMNDNAISSAINESHICKVMYENNIILNVIL